jgi:protein TonB
MSFVLVLPVKKGDKGVPFFARLVAPEDIGLNSEEIALPEGPAVTETIPVPPPPEKALLQSELIEQLPPPTTMFGGGPQIQQGKGLGTPGDPQGKGTDIQDSRKAENLQPITPPGAGLSFPLRRDNLFDRDIIAKYAEKGDGQERSSITFESDELRSYGYRQGLKYKIEAIWQYPTEALMRGIYWADLYLNFTINKNGTLVDIELIRTSGYKSLDDAAIKALKDAAPYWPLPEDWGKDTLTIKGHFIYSAYGVYIR